MKLFAAFAVIYLILAMYSFGEGNVQRGWVDLFIAAFCVLMYFVWRKK